MMKHHASFCVYLVLLASTWRRVLSQDENPNLIVVMTDEQNFRTVGAYRNLMSDDQAFPWGEGVSVDTPNIDRLAREGTLQNIFYLLIKSFQFVLNAFIYRRSPFQEFLRRYSTLYTFKSILHDRHVPKIHRGLEESWEVEKKTENVCQRTKGTKGISNW